MAGLGLLETAALQICLTTEASVTGGTVGTLVGSELMTLPSVPEQIQSLFPYKGSLLPFPYPIFLHRLMFVTYTNPVHLKWEKISRYCAARTRCADKMCLSMVFLASVFRTNRPAIL